MSDDTKNRVIAEAALAQRYHNEINERASQATIPALVARVERLAPASPGGGASEPVDLSRIEEQLRGFSSVEFNGQVFENTFGLDAEMTVAQVLGGFITEAYPMLLAMRDGFQIALDEDGVPYFKNGE